MKLRYIVSQLMVVFSMVAATTTHAAMVVTYDGLDLDTRGNWVDVYGADGWIIAGLKAARGPVYSTAPSNADGSLTDYTSLPDFISGYSYDTPANWFSFSGTGLDQVGTSLENLPSPNTLSPYNKILSVAASGLTNSLTLNLTGTIPQKFELHLYAHSGGFGRNNAASYTIGGVTSDVLTTASGGANDTIRETTVTANPIDSLDRGVWYNFTINNAVAGPLTITLTRTTGATNSPFQGLMIDVVPVPEPSSLLLLLLGFGVIRGRFRRTIRSAS